ncbi:ABC transporter substrate-binding protein [Paenibacillus sp. ACRSA]|uniref:ABC transporter substrate-binding protein n=1 Tax=Paenibacillus sp. ACRSA TaxID=2918211 RepID=UPI001EF5B235|nr:ABC transporter substrate-binding protein [Paenibacillus sp. ACRSA]MCG7376502.1 ABC transporter substrate-binding protein [Paenibacillus sp. ACRSA]
MDTTTAHYIRLTTTTEVTFKLHTPVPVTIDTLSTVLCCTPRNVKFILRKLEEKGFIHWQPGIGRGHHSTLTLLHSENEVMEDRFLELMRKGKMKEAIEFISTMENNETLREQLLDSLYKQMGFHSHAESSSGQDVLRMMRSRRLADLDPAFVYNAFETYLLGQVCSTLVTYDAKTDTFLPDLAHMWEGSKDHQVWTFYLRKGVRFHHNRMLTSKDVEFTLQRLRSVHSPVIWLYRDIERIEVAGDYCIRFYLNRPNQFFLHLLSCIPMTILPYDVDVSKQLIGTGPFQISEINEDLLKLSAFDNYYSIRPYLDQVHFWFVPDLESNERHYELPGTDRLEHSTHYAQTNSFNYPALGCQYMLFNFNKLGIFHHPKFRQAMKMVYDPVSLVAELGGNRITPANSFLPWKSAEYHWTPSSLEQARNLLHSSGYLSETLILSYSENKDALTANWLQQRAQQIGLNIELSPTNECLYPTNAMNADLILAEEILEEDWQYGMIHFFTNRSNHLHICMSPHSLDELEQKLDSFAQLDTHARAQLLDEAEDLLRDNDWILHGCHMNKRAQLNQSLFGMQTADFGYMDISKLWIKDQ